MRLSPGQKAKIHQKESLLTDAEKREKGVNYYEGWFFVTLKTRENVPVLSLCEGNPAIPDGQPGAPKCRYTKVGKGVIDAWHRMSELCKTAETDLCEAMPDHFHGLVHLLDGNRRHLGSLISGFMSGCSHAYWDTLGIEWRNNRDEKVQTKQHGGKSAYARLTPDRDKDHTCSLIGPALFVHGYNDMEPVTPEQVEIRRAYIRDQARKRLIQGGNHDCFRKYRCHHSDNWTKQRIKDAISSDRVFRYNNDKCIQAQNAVMERLLTDGRGVCLDCIGDKSLLYNKRKFSLICHSAEASMYEKQKEAVITAAREGAVIVSAFISQKEREIKQFLITEWLPFIEITDNGFSERYKGVGKAFYALAEKRLLQITPWKYLYQKKGFAVTREMCLVMNELARVVSGAQDDWWKTAGSTTSIEI